MARRRPRKASAEHPQPQLVEQRQDVPQLAGDVVLAHQGHIVDLEAIPFDALRQRVRLPGAADVPDHAVPGDAVAEVLGAIEARRVHRHHRGPPAICGFLTDSPDVIADQGRDAGVVDEDRRRAVGVDGLLDGVEQPLLAAAHDHVLLGQIRSHADLVEGGPGGARPAVVPGRPIAPIWLVGSATRPRRWRIGDGPGVARPTRPCLRGPRGPWWGTDDFRGIP